VVKDYKDVDKHLLDPDVRFFLANERTLLAWVRTGLTLQAAGFALAHFGDGTFSSTSAGVVAIICGGVLAVIGYNRFKEADRAIRKHKLPKTTKGAALEVITVVAIAFLLATIQIIALVID
jgi:putative membrane protein